VTQPAATTGALTSLIAGCKLAGYAVKERAAFYILQMTSPIRACLTF